MVQEEPNRAKNLGAAGPVRLERTLVIKTRSYSLTHRGRRGAQHSSIRDQTEECGRSQPVEAMSTSAVKLFRERDLNDARR